jgi:hypothetical protein
MFTIVKIIFVVEPRTLNINSYSVTSPNQTFDEINKNIKIIRDNYSTAGA